MGNRVSKSSDPEEALRTLRSSVIRYVDPLEPVGLEDWEPSDLETVALSTDPEFLELIQDSRSRHARDCGLSSLRDAAPPGRGASGLSPSIPLSQLPEATEQQRLAELEARGLVVVLPRRTVRGAFHGPVLPNRGKLASEMIIEDRR